MNMLIAVTISYSPFLCNKDPHHSRYVLFLFLYFKFTESYESMDYISTVNRLV